MGSCSRNTPAISSKLMKTVQKKLEYVAELYPGTKEVRIVSRDGDNIVYKDKETGKASSKSAELQSIFQLSDAAKSFGQTVSEDEEVEVGHIQGRHHMLTWLKFPNETHILTFFSAQCREDFDFLNTDIQLKSLCGELAQLLAGVHVSGDTKKP